MLTRPGRWLVLLLSLMLATPGRSELPDLFQFRAATAVEQLLQRIDREAELHPELRTALIEAKTRFAVSPPNEGRLAIISKFTGSNSAGWRNHLEETAKSKQAYAKATIPVEATRIDLELINQLLRHDPCPPLLTNGEVSLRDLLLSAVPRYREAPLLEREEGWALRRQVPVTPAKALSLNLPASWMATARGGYVAYFANEASFGVVSIGIDVAAIPVGFKLPLSNAAIAAFTPSGSNLLFTGPATIGGQPAQVLMIEANDAKGNPVRSATYLFQLDQKLVSLNFFVNSSAPGEKAVEETRKRHELLFNAIAADVRVEDLRAAKGQD